MRRYPAAEKWLETYRMPAKECAVTRELYDYCRPVVDLDRVRLDAYQAGHRGEALEHILAYAFDYSTN